MKYFQIKLTKDCLSCQAPDCLFPGKYLRETFFVKILLYKFSLHERTAKVNVLKSTKLVRK